MLEPLILTFKDAKTVLGVQALEALGLRVDPSTGELEATRPKGVAYFYCVDADRPIDRAERAVKLIENEYRINHHHRL